MTYRHLVGVHVFIETMIDCDRQRVAAFATDPANDQDWIGGVIEAKKLTEGPVGVGTRVARVADFLGRRFSYTLEVTDMKPDQKIVMTTNSPFPMTVVYEFEGARRHTLMRIRVSGEPKGFFRLAGPFLPRMVRRNVMKDLDRLKQCLEGRPVSSPDAS